MSDQGGILRFVHSENIRCYQKILRTYLTDKERCFVERRLAEEKAALKDVVEGNTAGHMRLHAA